MQIDRFTTLTWIDLAGFRPLFFYHDSGLDLLPLIARLIEDSQRYQKPKATFLDYNCVARRFINDHSSRYCAAETPD